MIQKEVLQDINGIMQGYAGCLFLTGLFIWSYTEYGTPVADIPGFLKFLGGRLK